jgi:cytochrome P450
LVKEVFSTSTDLIERPTGAGHLGEAFGPGSTFSLAGDALLARRKLVVPPFHGQRVRSYEHIIEEEVMLEIAKWPEGREFKTLQPMMRMTLNVILRAVFGAEGPALDELRGLLPPLVAMVGAIAVLPPSMRRDLGPWSPGGAVSAVPAPLRHCRRLAHRRCAGRPGPRRAQRRALAAGAGPLRRR